MIQKVLKVGTSAAVTIPKKSLEELGLKIGDRVFVGIVNMNQRVIISKNKIDNMGTLSKDDLEVIKWTKSFIKKYQKELEKLAKSEFVANSPKLSIIKS